MAREQSIRHNAGSKGSRDKKTDIEIQNPDQERSPASKRQSLPPELDLKAESVPERKSQHVARQEEESGIAPRSARQAPAVSREEAARPLPKRRPAGPARARIAASDDRPSIGGLIFSLQQKPSNRPYTIALIATGVWSLLGLLLAWAVLGQELAKYDSTLAAVTSAPSIAIIATIVIPIALFWFLAMLVLRAQELKLMSSAMTEVAIRLAEPDKMAEQQVASLGQTVRRQVAAMNDAIGRALGRAGELEALVHNEVAALERSYSENELRVRSLIDELASEREALTNNSERVSDALNNIGLRVAQDLATSGDRVTKALTAATNSLADSLATKGEKVTAAISAAGKAIDEKLAERGGQITSQIVTQGADAATKIHDAGKKINDALQESTDRTTALVTSRGNSLLTALSSMNDRIRNELPTLLESLGGEQVRLSQIIESAVKNLADLELSIVNRTGALENTLGKRTEHLQNVLTQHLHDVDEAVIERANALDTAMLERTKALDAAFTQRVEQINTALDDQAIFLQNTLKDRSKAIETSLAEQASSFDETFMRGVTAFRGTTDNLTKESVRTIEALAGQADMLKSVSEGLLNQVHDLTGRFETRGNSIMNAAHSLESSQFKIDSLLENRQTELNSLIDVISNKTGELDTMMRSYSTRLEGSLTDAQRRANELTQSISNESNVNSKSVINELEKLRMEAQQQTEQAVVEMRGRFSNITSEVSEHINALSSNFANTTSQIRERTQMASGQIDATQSEIRRKMDELPELTRETASSMRNALHDQLKAIDSLSSIASEHNRSRDVSYPAGKGGKAPAQQNSNQQQAPGTQQVPQQPSRQVPQQPAATATSNGNQTPPAGLMAGQRQALGPASGMSPGSRSQQNPNVPVQQGQQGAGGNPGAMQGDPSRWSMGDLLERASTDQARKAQAQAQAQAAAMQQQKQHQQSAPQHPQHGGGRSNAVKGGALDMQVIAQAIEPRVAADIWRRYQSGERGIFNRSLYTQNGQATFDDIYQRYKGEPEFKHMVDSYLGDFERLLREADQKDPRGQLVQNYLTSETGRVYLLLAHASGRLG
ncbi:MAG: hypothetical protein ACRBBN_14360 [Methyloligellaceae bacterium]